jgi:hypothetical protein
MSWEAYSASYAKNCGVSYDTPQKAKEPTPARGRFPPERRIAMQEDKEKEQRIRERAYQIWLNEGQFDDAKELHWERAKREIEEEDRKDHQPRDK